MKLSRSLPTALSLQAAARYLAGSFEPAGAGRVNNKDHDYWMQRCLALAGRGAGNVSPNPMVGAVLVDSEGTLLGEGWHEAFGGPHAEPNAIAAAEQQHGAKVLRGATLYVNLEPCSHHGKTPPCADLIVQKGIRWVVVGMADPFPKVAGRGLTRLREHGVEVLMGVQEKACQRFNEAFTHHIRTGRPLVTLKIAQTLDGHIATETGDSRWVSGQAARHRVHHWRARLDGVLVGRGTAQQDDPALTVRHVAGRQPQRFVLDGPGTLSPHLQLFTDTAAHRTTALIAETAEPAYAEALQERGGRLLRLPTTTEGHLDLLAMLKRLGQDGGREGLPLQSLLVEAGPGLATALFRQDLVDRFYLFIAPKLLGTGIPVLHTLGVQQMADALIFAESRWEQVEHDMLFRGYRHGV